MTSMMKRLLLTLLCPLAVLCATAQSPIVPMPAAVSWGQATCTLPSHVTISCGDGRLAASADYLADCLNRYAGISAQVGTTKGNLRLTLNRRLAPGGYRLTVGPAHVSISAADHEGACSAVATLSQMLLAQGTTLRQVVVDDTPRFAWRGFHLDCSRHFWTVDETKRVIDVMALFKLNRFHWHLTDDQGWRIEIKKYPLLTERGAWRPLNDQDSACMQRARQTDDPQMLLPADRLRSVPGGSGLSGFSGLSGASGSSGFSGFSGVSGFSGFSGAFGLSGSSGFSRFSGASGEPGSLLYGGFYTQDDIRHVVTYAQQRGIEVIPEIDMPGHFLSAIDNYEGLSCFPQTGWGEYFTTPLCPGKDRALQFCRDIWDEVMPLFPFSYVHIGGDEVRRDTWERCPDCQRRIAGEQLDDEDALQAWFIRQMEKYINQHGKRMMGWDEIMQGGLSPSATVMWWRSWVGDAPQRAMEQGNDVVACPAQPMYFSQGEEKNSLRDVYDYQLPAQPTKGGRLLGVQGNMWTEYIPTIERALYMYFPRMMALSELAWSQPARRDFADFQRRQTALLPVLRRLDVPYRLPALEGFHNMNAFIDQTLLTAVSPDTSATVHYTTDGTVPTLSSPRFERPLSVSQTTLFRLRPFTADGRGDATADARFVKQGYLLPLPPATVPARLEPGLTATWHDTRLFSCDSLHLAPVNATYRISDVCIPEGVSGHIGLIISGYIDIPADGIYTFALKSDDGSWLKIDGNMVVDNDQPQSPHEETAQQALAAGMHYMEVRYWDHNGGMLRLIVSGPDGQPLPVGKTYFSD